MKFKLLHIANSLGKEIIKEHVLNRSTFSVLPSTMRDHISGRHLLSKFGNELENFTVNKISKNQNKSAFWEQHTQKCLEKSILRAGILVQFYSDWIS